MRRLYPSPTKMEFYATMVLNERWSVREPDKRINSQLYERTKLSKKPELTIASNLHISRDERKMSTDLVLKDPYVLDFLDLKDSYSEKDLEREVITRALVQKLPEAIDIAKTHLDG